MGVIRRPTYLKGDFSEVQFRDLTPNLIRLAADTVPAAKLRASIENSSRLSKIVEDARTVKMNSLTSAIEAATISVNLPVPVETLKLRIKPESGIANKDYLVTIISINSEPTEGNSLGDNWYVSSAFKGPYHYLPRLQGGTPWSSPEVKYKNPISSLEFAVIPWSNDAMRNGRLDARVTIEGALLTAFAQEYQTIEIYERTF